MDEGRSNQINNALLRMHLFATPQHIYPFVSLTFRFREAARRGIRQLFNWLTRLS